MLSIDYSKGVIVSGFPGVGKSYFAASFMGTCTDSDSSLFDKSEFPANYMDHIAGHLQIKTSVILVSSHKVVRDALIDRGFSFCLVYPDQSLKAEYLERYRSRNSSQAFIDLIDKNWDAWLTECREVVHPLVSHYVLSANWVLADLF